MREPILKRESLSRQIIPILREEILTRRQPGQRLEPIEQMAKRFRVSFPTMREALSVLEQEGLIERHVGRGTFVGDTTKNRHVAVLVERDITDSHASYFYRRVPQRLVRFLRHNGFSARLYIDEVPVGDESLRPVACTEFLEAAMRHQLCGLAVLVTPPHPFAQWCPCFETLRADRVPVVAERGKIAEEIEARVDFDYRTAIRMGTQHLLDCGCRRIALLEFRLPPCRLEDGNRDEMAEGFLAAMASSGVEINPRWVRRNLHPCTPGAGWEDFRQIWTAQREKPDGLLICDDNLFPGAATAICQLGIRVHGDMAVVSHFVRGNSNMTVAFPVTKLEFDPDLYVQVMGETLLKLMRKEPVASAEVKLPCRLMEASGGGSARGPGGRGTLVTAIPAAECRDGELALLGGI